MKLAIPYENGQIFQHFGKTEQFKIYDIQEGNIAASEILDTMGTGHEALAAYLEERGVEAVICGGIGGGAEAALTSAGIAIFSGVSGEADEAVQVYLNGELMESGATCDHHEEEAEEGCSCSGDCGSGCGGCGGAPEILLEGKNAGKTCKVHYRGTFNNGVQFDSSYDRGQTLDFICGAGQMIRGFDAAVVDMEVGEIREIHLMPEEAYGPSDPNAIFTIAIAELPGSEELTVGQQVYLQNQFGQPFPVKVTDKTEETITFDANHEMAGKELNFTIELVEVVE